VAFGNNLWKLLAIIRTRNAFPGRAAGLKTETEKKEEVMEHGTIAAGRKKGS
jgi:hypothetical protein